MNTVLITGGAGFIGSHLAENLLLHGYSVIIIDNFSTGHKKNLIHLKKNRNLTVVNEDILNIDKIQPYFKNIDGVFHLAALADIVPSIEYPVNYYYTNVNGTFNVIECCRKNNVKKIIYAASSSCYGFPDKYPTKEISKIKPMYPYALTKYLGERLIMHWSEVYALNAISLRLFNVYGPRSRTSGTYGAVFNVFLAQKLAKKPFTIVGDGKQTRDFTYVTDIVNSFLFAYKSSISNEIFNIGSGNTYSINYLTTLLKGKKIYIPKRPGEPDCTFADISKSKKLLKWKPIIKFEIGVKKVLDNIENWSDAPVWDSDSIAIATKKWFKFLK